MAQLWANAIKDGLRTIDEVPRLLKNQVREILIESGMEELIAE